MNTNRDRAVMAAYIILRRGGKILLGRRLNTGYEDGNYQMPAGHVDPGESPIDCVVREAKEEVGVDIKRENIKLVHSGYRYKVQEQEDRVDYYFEATVWEGEPQNMEPDKCDDLQWFDADAPPPNMVPHVAEAMAATRNGEIYSEIRI